MTIEIRGASGVLMRSPLTVVLSAGPLGLALITTPWRRIAGSISVAAMRTRLRQSLCSVLAVLLLVSAGCNNDKPKQEEAKKEPTPVPSDLVFNDFLPTTGGGPAAGIRARDASVEGGLADIQGGPGDQDPNGGGQVAGNGTKVVEPGADPKAVRKYTFVMGKVDKRVVSINTAVQQAMGGQQGPAQEISMKVALDLTVKAVKKEGATLEMKLTKVDIPGAPPQVAPMLAQLAGMAGTFDVTPQGDVGEIALQASPAMRNELAQTVVQALSQAVQLLVCPLPSDPIGAGAKWDVAGAPGQPDQGVKHFVAKELTADGAVVDTDIDIHIPRRMQQTQRGNVFLEVQGKGKYTYNLKWNSTAPHVEGGMAINEKIEAGGGAPNQPKQVITQIQTVKHTVDSAK